MSQEVKKSKQQYMKDSRLNLKEVADKKAWVALNQYFDGAGNGPEAKVACVVITNVIREMQAENNKEQLALNRERIKLGMRTIVPQLPQD